MVKRLRITLNGDYKLEIQLLPEDIMYMAWAVSKQQALYAFTKSFSEFGEEKPFILKAYVGTEVQRVDEMGYSDFDYVFRNAPAGHRYAVTQVGKEFWCIDLRNSINEALSIRKGTCRSIRKGTYRAFSTLDAAIMAALHLYRKDDNDIERS